MLKAIVDVSVLRMNQRQVLCRLFKAEMDLKNLQQMLTLRKILKSCTRMQ